MRFREIVVKNRSYRRFDQGVSIGSRTLRELIELARLSASASNLQPLKFMAFNERQINASIFPFLGWAGYLDGWAGPTEGERPAAYILILADTTIGTSFEYDCGIAAQSILLGATEQGLGGCMIGSIQRTKLRSLLTIPPHLQIQLVLALGKPNETVILEEAGVDGDIRYWRDNSGKHHVPKRSLDELIIERYQDS